jgi:hypothetical protein
MTFETRRSSDARRRAQQLPGDEKSNRALLRFGTETRSHGSSALARSLRASPSAPPIGNGGERGGTDEQAIRGPREGP